MGRAGCRQFPRTRRRSLTTVRPSDCPMTEHLRISISDERHSNGMRLLKDTTARYGESRRTDDKYWEAVLPSCRTTGKYHGNRRERQ
ncbi:hypothetical protein D805_1113 [Bifidobacterium thermophilum RBL67]|uniref:Uncharacterized protein n=1 Tax=Bifidobacterium thermophilum RBL67 TaxID=1254439 RepID=M4RD22_9BIFI|nr:hypothetical protein D805_1113 [Bifidobacterium thermophilum RBL67]